MGGNHGDEHYEREKAEVDGGKLRTKPCERAGTQHVVFKQIVDRKGHHQHECHGNAEAKGRLNVLGHGYEGAHAQEVGENHIVDKYRPDEYVEIFHTVVCLGLIFLEVFVDASLHPDDARHDDEGHGGEYN